MGNDIKTGSKQYISVVFFLLCSFFLFSCGQASPAKDPLNGTRWLLSSLYGEPPQEGTRITLEFSGGFVRGFAGCNEYDRLVIGDDEDQNKYKVTENGSLTIPGFIVTALACPTPEGVMDQEDAYLTALRSAFAFRLIENTLEIEDGAGNKILVFIQQ